MGGRKVGVVGKPPSEPPAVPEESSGKDSCLQIFRPPRSASVQQHDWPYLAHMIQKLGDRRTHRSFRLRLITVDYGFLQTSNFLLFFSLFWHLA